MTSQRVSARISACRRGAEDDHETLAKAVLNTEPNGSLRNELSLLRFARIFLEQWRKLESPPEVITPGQVRLKLVKDGSVANVSDLGILRSRADVSGSIYEVPPWCPEGEQWRFQLGFLLRFILSRHPVFTRLPHQVSWSESEVAYRPAEAHWYQRLYGLFNGRSAFGDDWVPITD